MSKKRVRFSVFLLPIVILCIGLLLSLTSFFDYKTYSEATEVPATVTHSTHKPKDPAKIGQEPPLNGRSTYIVYVTYTFDGVTYENIQWKTSYQPISAGEKVSVRVSPNNPRDLLISNPLYLLLLGILGLAVGLVLAFKFIPALRSGKEFYVKAPASASRAVAYLFVIFPIAIAAAFTFAGFTSHYLFFIGTIASLYFALFSWEVRFQ